MQGARFIPTLKGWGLLYPLTPRDKGNREGSAFRCRKCGFELHADLNASRNIAQAGISCLSRLQSQPAKCDTTLS